MDLLFRNGRFLAGVANMVPAIFAGGAPWESFAQFALPSQAEHAESRSTWRKSGG